MAIATTLKNYLDNQQVRYDTVRHAQSATALESAHAADVPDHQVAKAVVLADDQGYVVGVLPSNRQIDLHRVKNALGRDLDLVPEDSLGGIFGDCALGAVPALADAYGVAGIWDEHFENVSDVYLEAGDHENLVHLAGDDFRRLMAGAPHSRIAIDRAD
ncbi:MAG: YbaK/EbsC family protein [Gammaproteobacteria bacterium]